MQATVLTFDPETSCGTVVTDDGHTAFERWQPGGTTPLDRAIAATRAAVFPLHGLDPHDPRD